MHLRRQLLVVSLLLLSLPWAGCQFIREMEGALRQGQEQSLAATASAIGAVVGQRPGLIYPNPDRLGAPPDEGRSIYAIPLEQPLILDGYGDGWEDIASSRLSADGDGPSLALQYKAVTRGDYLYLLLRVEDQEVIYHNPGLSAEPNGDRLVLRTWQDDRRQDYVIATAAPGKVQARAASRRKRGLDPRRIRGYWQDARGGYTLEIEIPLSFTGGRLGFYVANATGRGGGALQTLGNIRPIDSGAPPWLIYSPTSLQQALMPFRHQGSRVQVVDREGWVVADMPPSNREQGSTDGTFWLFQLIYRSILDSDPQDMPPNATLGKTSNTELETALTGQAASGRYRNPDYSSRSILTTASPVRQADEIIGAILLHQSGEEYLSLTDQAFTRLFGYSLLAVAMGTLGLFAYASVLSWRIGHLSKAANRALEDESLQLATFPRSHAKDEIGELSRNYADLLQRLREYNDYLSSLSRKLSHELRTPVAVIQTSLENLEHDSDDRDTYLRRAREGLQRLGSILTAMSEANRLEESIRSNERLDLDLVPLLKEVYESYRSIYRQQILSLHLEPEAARVSGAADLLVQALDKLMDNAASFCPAGGDIRLSLNAVESGWAISIENDGPTLPPEMQQRLFEPMVSLRDEGGESVHLGLGLHIVRLISDFHGGKITAQNRPGGNGASFSLTLPALEENESV